jgi:hypothetical protein
MDLYIIHFFHVVFTLLAVNYPFISSANKLYDLIYIICVFLLLYSYIILNRECFVSYAIKKYNDPSYIAGTDVSTVEDYSIVLKSEILASYVILYILLTFVVSSFVVLKRQNFINVKYIYVFSVLLICYFVSLRIPMLAEYSYYSNLIFASFITLLLYNCVSNYIYYS